MPAPIIPAPRTPTLVAWNVSMPSGRNLPALIACRSKKNAWIMFLKFWPTIRWSGSALSIRLAVSKSTCAPSTAAERIARWAG